jgi:hypothetical protein
MLYVRIMASREGLQCIMALNCGGGPIFLIITKFYQCQNWGMGKERGKIHSLDLGGPESEISGSTLAWDPDQICTWVTITKITSAIAIFHFATLLFLPVSFRRIKRCALPQQLYEGLRNDHKLVHLEIIYNRHVDHSSQGLLGCDAACGRIPMFQRTMLPPSALHPENGGSNAIRNTGILPQHYMASQPRH